MITMILIVGDGNFSFSLSISLKYPGLKYFATSFENYVECCDKYGELAASNIRKLKERGCVVLNGVDATKLTSTLPQNLRNQFQKIVFNFPHTGRKASIKKNRELLKNFFVSAKEFLSPDGNVEVTLCAGQGGCPGDPQYREKCNHWQIIDMAAYAGMVLCSVAKFNLEDFPGYTCTGRRNAGKEFVTTGAVTHTFVASNALPALEEQDWEVQPTLLDSPTQQRWFPSVISERLKMAFGDKFLAQKYFSELLQKILNFNKKSLDIDSAVNLADSLRTLEIMGNTSSWVYFTQMSSSRDFLISNSHPILSQYETEKFSLKTIALQPISECFNGSGQFVQNPFQYQLILVDKSTIGQNSAENLLCAFSELNLNRKFSVKEVCLKLNRSVVSKELEALHFSPAMIRAVQDTKSSNMTCINLYHATYQDGTKHGFAFSLRSSNDGASPSITVVDMDLLCCLLITGVKVNEGHVLWSLNARTLHRLHEACVNGARYSPISIHPSIHTFHVSFWLPSGIQDTTGASILPDLLQLVWRICGSSLSSVRLTDVFIPGGNNHDCEKRISHCYEIKLHSHDFCISHNHARTVETLVRNNLPGFLKVSVR